MRSLWIQKLFSPLTMSMVEQMRVVGLDMTRADAHSLPLTAPQKNRFADFYRLVARSCRRQNRRNEPVALRSSSR